MTAAQGIPAPTERDLAIGRRLVEDADRLDWLAAWPLVVAARTELLDAIGGLSEPQAAWRPADDEWSVAEVIRHALNASRDVLRVIEGLAGGDPEGRRTRPGEQPRAAPARFAELRHEFVAHSVDVAALPARLPAAPNEQLTAPHARFGELNCRAWFLFQRLHDGDHRGQIARIRATAGFPSA